VVVIADVSGGIDLSAIETSYRATLGAARWLLGTASAFAALILAGIGLTDIGNTYGDAGRQIASLIAVLVAAGAVVAVLWFATKVLQVPYRDLTALHQLRERYLIDENWKKDWAREQFDLADRTVAAASGNRLSDVPQLHQELQRLLREDTPEQATVERDNAIADVVLAVANDMETGRRFARLRGVYLAAIVIVLGAATVFVFATREDPNELDVKSPVAARILPEAETWSSPLEDCPASELLGVAVSGRWPHPAFVTLGEEGCAATVSEGDAERFVVVPLVDGVPNP
jgi:cytochrome c biogenesis protein CcdA